MKRYLLAFVLGGIVLSAGVAYATVSQTITLPTVGQLLYSASGNAGGVATSSETCTSPLSCTPYVVLTGGGAISLGTVTVANGGTGTTTAGFANGLYWNNAGTFTNSSNATCTTALCTFSNATTTLVSGTSAWFTNASTTNISVGTNEMTGIRSPSFIMASTTAWTGTSTLNGVYGDFFQTYAPASGAISQVYCGTNTGTLEVEATDGSTHVYMAASSTAGLENFVLSFAKGDLIQFNAGNPATSPTTLTCTLIGNGF